MNQQSEIGRQRAFAKPILAAVAFAVVVTALGWFIMGSTSPINHGVSPDVHDRPWGMAWVMANMPATVLFVSVFSKQGSEAQYFLCVFIEMLAYGLLLALGLRLYKRA